MKLCDRIRLITSAGKDVELTEDTSVANNLLYSLFNHCKVSLKVVTDTQSFEHNNYRSSLDTLLTHGTDVASSHSTNT